MGLNRAMQIAVASVLEADPAVIAAAPRGTGKAAVFAPGQAFPDLLPRVTFEKLQVLLVAVVCGVPTFEVFLTVHCWAGSAEATLLVGDLADAVRKALDVNPAPAGFTIMDTDHFRGQREASDPDPKVQHLVLTFRYLLKPN